MTIYNSKIRCGCQDSTNTPLNWVFCQQTGGNTQIPGCAVQYSKTGAYCIQCNTGYQLLPDGQCVAIAVDSTNCSARTSTGNCRLCDTSNGYFLDYDTLMCIQGSLKVPSATNTNSGEGLGGCLFAKKDTNKIYQCFQCTLGFYLVNSAAIGGNTYTYCKAVNLDAQQLQVGGTLNYSMPTVQLATGKWNC